MSEFDPSRPEPSPEMQLLARMKLQRVVFSAFAIVLVCLFALGLSAYRDMQRSMQQAVTAREDAQRNQGVAEAKLQSERREHGTTRNELDDTRRRLGYSKARLGVHEVRDGNEARARELIAESSKLGPPPWLDFAGYLADERVARFTSEYPDRGVLCGAVSGDRSVMGVLRGGESGLVLEFYAARTGEALSAIELPAGEPAPQHCHLLLDRTGARFFLRAGELVRHGDRESAGNPRVAGDMEIQPGGACLGLWGDPELQVIYEAAGENGLWVRRPRGDDAWTLKRIKDADVRAVCGLGGGYAYATPDGVFTQPGFRDTVAVLSFESSPDRVALRACAGELLVATATGRELKLMAIPPEGEIDELSHLTPEEKPGGLRFLSDGTLLWNGGGGQVLAVDFNGFRELTLGGYELSFVERHPQGVVFGNRRGELSVRSNADYRLAGVPVDLLPPGWTARARPHGWIAEDAASRQSARLRSWTMVPLGAWVALTPEGAAWSDERLRLPDGNRIDISGKLIGGFPDGTVLVYSAPGTLKRVGPEVEQDLVLPLKLEPKSVQVAAGARVVAMCLGDTVYVTDLNSEPRPFASRIEAAPDLLALDSEGEVLGVVYGATVTVKSLKGGERSVLTAAPPREIALLFGGSILASVEDGSIAYYEVETGRELLRGGQGVESIAASAHDSLRIVAGGRLRELRFSVGE